MLDNIRQEEIEKKNYTFDDAAALSKTLGLAISAGHCLKSLKTAALRGCLKKFHVDMVSSWNTVCGIAEYTKFYVESLSDDVDFTIFPPKSDSLLSKDGEFVRERVWNYHDSSIDLANALLSSDSEIVHIQYTEGFFKTSELLSLINSLYKRKKIVVSCHNTKYLVPSAAEELTVLNHARYVVHQEQDRKNLLESGFYESNISLIPHGQIKTATRTPDKVRSVLGLNDRYPVIGSYGFLFSHKGICETIQAVGILKEKFPKIYYLASCALYEHPDSYACHNKCLELIAACGLADNVALITDFLKPKESLFLLQSCDLFAVLHGETAESASGSVRFCIAARRPLLVTKTGIFKEYADFTPQIENNSPASIAAGIEEILTPENYKRYSHLVNRIADENTWEKIGERYINLYSDLIANS
jgi:glycosyltransferase involved in cell wall biosynthesis